MLKCQSRLNKESAPGKGCTSRSRLSNYGTRWSTLNGKKKMHENENNVKVFSQQVRKQWFGFFLSFFFFLSISLWLSNCFLCVSYLMFFVHFNLITFRTSSMYPSHFNHSLFNVAYSGVIFLRKKYALNFKCIQCYLLIQWSFQLRPC